MIRYARPLRMLLTTFISTVVCVTAAACAAAGPHPSSRATTTADTAARADRRVTRAPKLRFAAVSAPLSNPTWVGSAPRTGGLYATEQSGRLVRIQGRRVHSYLDVRRITSQNGGEQGLLSAAFDPNFATTHRFWIYTVLRTGNAQVREYRGTATKVMPGSGKVIMNIKLAPPAATNHNGGQLQARTGPGGRTVLFIGVGDGGAGGDPLGNAQNLRVRMGKILRIEPKVGGGYRSPAGNPFVHRAGALNDIWALGLRNPWRFSFDRVGGALWIGDVGQSRWEEVDVAPGTRGGQNYGWGRFEARSLYNAARKLASGTRHTPPRLQYSHASGRCSITGGYRYRGRAIRALIGTYVYADWCSTTLMGYDPARGTQWSRPRSIANITSFGEDRFGELYVTSGSTGRVYKLVAG